LESSHALSDNDFHTSDHIRCTTIAPATPSSPLSLATMTLLILTETSAGYALFKARDKTLLKRDDLAKDAETVEGVCSLMKLKQFKKFGSASIALEEAAALTEGKVRSLQ